MSDANPLPPEHKTNEDIREFFSIFHPEDNAPNPHDGDTVGSLPIFTPERGTGSAQWGHLQFLVVKFISEHCIRDISRWIGANALREALSKESGQAIDARQLGRVLKSLGVIRVRRRRTYHRYYAYLGLTFKEDSAYSQKETTGTEPNYTNPSLAAECQPNGDTYNLSTDTCTPEKLEPGNGDSIKSKADADAPKNDEIGYVELEPD